MVSEWVVIVEKPMSEEKNPDIHSLSWFVDWFILTRCF